MGILFLSNLNTFLFYLLGGWYFFSTISLANSMSRMAWGESLYFARRYCGENSRFRFISYSAETYHGNKDKF